MMKKKVLVLGVCIVIAFAAAEIFARYGLGLGDPPIVLPDKEMDYVFQPNQVCNRFGRHIIYNNASMRCDFDVKAYAGQRIFIVGDSVVNGGVLTDHKALATAIMQDKFNAEGKPIQVCHVSAGSWGPGNYAAYFRRYRSLVGTNDVLIVEVNSHDLWEDDPKVAAGANVGKDIALPSHKPCCALWDGFDRYFMPRMRKWLGKAKVNTKVDVPKWQSDANNDLAKYNLAMLDEVFAYPWCKKYLLIHRSRKETQDNVETAGEAAFRAFAKNRGIPVVMLKLDHGVDYRDTIHMSESGQRKMADAILETLARVPGK